MNRQRSSPRKIGAARVAVVLLALLVPAMTAPSVFASHARDRSELRSLMSAVVAAGAPAYLVDVIDANGEWQGAAGRADLRSPKPASPEAQFRIGSISKMFVATAVLQQVARGRVDLDAPIDRYLPGLLSQGSIITVRELLQHRAGLADPSWGADDAAVLAYFEAACHARFDRITQVKQSDFQLYPPGTDFFYANADYIVLGLLLERVTHRPYAQVIRDGILVPLGLTRTSFQDGSPRWSGPYLHGYSNLDPAYADPATGNYEDRTDCNMTQWSAAGSGISTTHDIAHFLWALTHGRLLPDSLYQQMIDGVPTPYGFAYGFGIGRIQTSCGELLSHDGAVYGYTDDVYAVIDGSRIFVDAIPLFPGTNAIWTAESAVARAELCT